jgi:hypothetical protein
MKMRSEASLQKEEQALKAAEVLAEFANLDQDGAKGFIKAHPDFVPPVWWTGRAWKDGVGTSTPWMRERDLLRKAWVAGFPADKTLELATTSLFLIGHALASDTTEEMESTPKKIWPYQRAVLFLHVNPTKARICEWRECGRRFISETKAQFCRFGLVVNGNETTCFWEHRKKEKADNWNENRDRVNERRRQEYKKVKRKGKA